MCAHARLLLLLLPLPQPRRAAGLLPVLLLACLRRCLRLDRRRFCACLLSCAGRGRGFRRVRRPWRADLALIKSRFPSYWTLNTGYQPYLMAGLAGPAIETVRVLWGPAKVVPVVAAAAVVAAASSAAAAAALTGSRTAAAATAVALAAAATATAADWQDNLQNSSSSRQQQQQLRAATARAIWRIPAVIAGGCALRSTPSVDPNGDRHGVTATTTERIAAEIAGGCAVDPLRGDRCTPSVDPKADRQHSGEAESSASRKPATGWASPVDPFAGGLLAPLLLLMRVLVQ